MNIRIFGIQRSGTNYLEQLINTFSGVVATPGVPERGYWKHSAYPAPRFMPQQDIYFLVIKNPFKWLESLHRYNADLSIRSGTYHQNLFNCEKKQQTTKYLIRDSRNYPTANDRVITIFKI